MTYLSFSYWSTNVSAHSSFIQMAGVKVGCQKKTENELKNRTMGWPGVLTYSDYLKILNYAL